MWVDLVHISQSIDVAWIEGKCIRLVEISREESKADRDG